MKLSLSIPGADGTPIQIDENLPGGIPTGGLTTTGDNLIITIINVVILIAFFLSLLYIIRGGFNMITSGGDKQRFQLGRERVRYAIIGLLIIFFSFAFVNIFSALLGVDLLSFSD